MCFSRILKKYPTTKFRFLSFSLDFGGFFLSFLVIILGFLCGSSSRLLVAYIILISQHFPRVREADKDFWQKMVD